MKRLSTLALSATLATACVQKGDGDGVQAARDALPTSSSLSISVPGQASKGQEKVGDVALSYLLTRTVAGVLNGSSALVLGLAKAISDYPVTSVEGDTYIWGPWSEALKPGQYRMTARLTSAGDYAWTIEGRTKGTTVPFAAIVTGLASPGQPHRGSGSFTFDCDVAHAIDPYGGCDDGGQVSVSYDLEHSPASIAIDAQHLAPMPDGSQAEQTFHYEYSEAIDGSGALSFTSFGDTDDPGPAWETTTYMSRWKATGAGRTDLSISGGDLGAATVTAEECWNTSYQRTYFEISAGWVPTEGSPASCGF
jgi:hypothetical protein